MTDLPYLLKYKSSLFPIDDDLNHDYPGRKNKKPVKALGELCCSYFVKDCNFLRNHLDCIPIPTYWYLMSAALESCQTLVIDLLISNWPFRILSLRKLAPSLLNDIRVFYDSVFVKSRMYIAINYTTCMAHTFVECLKNKSPTKLRVLDLTGFPTAEVIVNYLASHMLLIYNEKKQHSIIDMYNELTTSQNSTDVYPLFQASSATFESNKFMICLDPCIDSESIEFCKALYLCKLDNDLFKIQIERLDLSEIGIARICVLLEQVHPESLKGLAVKYNGLNNSSLHLILELIGSFTSLTSLDLGCNNLSLSSSVEPTKQLSDTLHLLKNLIRLDLSNCRVTNVLETILSSLQSELVYLNLCGCCLGVNDLAYLSSSVHAKQLTHLDISENLVTPYFDSFKNLLRILHQNLIILQIEHCGLTADHQSTIFSYLPLFKSLRYLNISNNTQLSTEKLGPSGYLGNFLLTKVLDVVRISIPYDISAVNYPAQTSDDVKQFFNRTNGLIYAFCLGNDRHLLTLDFV